jgi:DNA-binding MarR family transcriptional regulator
MGKIIFGGKMFFLGTNRLLRPWLLPFGLTPARFNMMIAIASQRGGIPQQQLRSLLGVTTATICRMLKSLEELGFIRRTPHPQNARHRWLTLTAAGAFRLREAIIDVVDSVALPFTIAELLNPFPGNRRSADAAIRKTDRIFTRARINLGDIATLQFPFEHKLSPA